ncbi:TRAP transporter small permease [Silicimonas algicola]|uniref:TRAP transporter small permease protein n=1 Tax=Silicimonas algicola TaxID=1826607 RepID=A0A316G3Q3_9RHOB|nr:TRAP transporter small permease [Silicimonas algicola]AZQ67040.1 TRAP transporter small permease [Silicimonas algicola]PWK55438.1 TRAP-type C4-dicarboxylate transport system permease small subunit [Silicimonas algicola]
MKTLRRALDGLYLGCAILAALFLVAMLLIIVAQMVARWTGVTFPGAASYAGYCMASASFLAFANALNRGAHIRVGLLLTAVGRYRRWLELWCFAIGATAAWFLARYAVNLVLWSHQLGDVSQGQDATPLWIPQSAMALGAVVFAIALTDHLLRIIFAGDHGIAAELAGEGSTE